MTTSEQSTRAFTLKLHDGFIDLSVDGNAINADKVNEIAAYFARLLAVPADDENALAMAVNFAAVGASSGEGGIDHMALAFYRSPEDPSRAMMVAVTSVCLPASHADTESAVAGLTEIQRATGHDTVDVLALPAGPAVMVVTEEPKTVTMGEESVPVLRRAVTAWVPDPGGTTVAVVEVSSNNWQDWPHICRLALDIFRTLEWEHREPSQP